MTAGLAGRRVLVPESRELDLFSSMLERAGASVLRCPLVTILDLDDDAPVAAWLRRLVGGRFDDLVLYTGEGVKRLLATARRADMEAEVREALGRVRKIVRGPKPTRALREIGLAPEIAAATPTTAGLVEVMGGLDLAGRQVGIQCYPEQPPDLVDWLRAQGAATDPVLPYRYAADQDDGRVLDAIRAMADGLVDMVAFTSTPQVRRLADVARRHGALADLERAMERTAVASIGPVTTDALTRAGWSRIAAPAESFHLKPLIAAMGG